MNSKEEQKFDQFMESFKAEDYDWFVDLYLPAGTSEAEVNQHFDDWIHCMAEVDGTSNFRWVRMTEFVQEDTTLVLHVLVGGRDTSRRWVYMQGWKLDVVKGGSARTRRKSETKQLRGLIRYLVCTIGCGLRVGSKEKSSVLVEGDVRVAH